MLFPEFSKLNLNDGLQRGFSEPHPPDWSWPAYRDSEALAFGADKKEKDSVYNGFGDRDDEESGDVQAEEAGAAAGSAWAKGGASNKYTFREIRFSQIVSSQVLASAKCMYFHKLSQIICFRRNT